MYPLRGICSVNAGPYGYVGAIDETVIERQSIGRDFDSTYRCCWLDQFTPDLPETNEEQLFPVYCISVSMLIHSSKTHALGVIESR